MNRWIWSSVVLVAVGAGALWATRSAEPARPHAATAAPAAKAAPAPAPRVGNAIAPARSAAPEATAEPVEAGDEKVDPEKVRAALAHFREVASAISQEQLDTERSQLEAKLKELSSVPVEEPTPSDFVDARGTKWVKLTFPSGEVRYEFPEG